MFREKKALTLASLRDVPHGPGVYIIYGKSGQPIYVGRSVVSIHTRLVAHAQRRGSTKLADIIRRGGRLEFEWEELLSPHQAEAQLIRQLGKDLTANLRRETDPADW